ncbi:hypothetical protein [Comamonas thiooxydans]|uniref:hypothetical protein n=1 Tax=Comamonas thiooxydans TaxID=363952 RepID=UPI00209C6ACE|nr:hypothetical protein [Comamonas thiooxydans]MCO8250259.1 hypothetical protein [Comamonas thiooxydans]
MQDKITIADAPDCLNTNDKAMWVLGYEAAIEARGQCLHQIQEPAAAEQAAWHAGRAQATGSVSNATSQAAPAAVAVPDDRAAFERELIDNHHYVPSDFSFKDGFYNGDDDYIQFGWDVWQARAALDATPAAVPVVLPEPDAYNHGAMIVWSRKKGVPQIDGDLYTARTVRVLLATATGLPAQAVPAFCHVASLKLKSLQERGYQITGYALEKPVEGEQPERGFINHGGFVGWWWDGQSPQAQADARDAVLAHLDGLLDDAAAHIYPSDLNKFPTGEHTATVASVRMGNSSECSVPLYSREQVVEAFNTAQAAQGSEA